VGNTGCPGDDLAVFNYDEKARGWRAACHEKLFVCSAVGGGTRCTEQDAATLDQELFARSQLLFQLPKQRRDRFVSVDILAGTWDEYSIQVAAAAALSAKQLEKVEEFSALYTDFSPAFNDSLKSCIGADNVALFWSSGQSILMSPAKQCMSALRTSGELAFLHAVPRRKFAFATDVRGIKPLARPAVEAMAATPVPEPAPAAASARATDSAPADEAATTALNEKVRTDLDAAASDILTCVAADKTAVKVHVDAEGNATYSLMGALAGSGEEGCVRAVLKGHTFGAGPLDVVHLVKTAPAHAESNTE
jgi:hypothetical protein